MDYVQGYQQWHHSDVFFANFDLTSHLVLVFLLLTLNMMGINRWEYVIFETLVNFEAAVYIISLLFS